MRYFATECGYFQLIYNQTISLGWCSKNEELCRNKKLQRHNFVVPLKSLLHKNGRQHSKSTIHNPLTKVQRNLRTHPICPNKKYFMVSLSRFHAKGISRTISIYSISRLHKKHSSLPLKFLTLHYLAFFSEPSIFIKLPISKKCGNIENLTFAFSHTYIWCPQYFYHFRLETNETRNGHFVCMQSCIVKFSVSALYRDMVNNTLDE